MTSERPSRVRTPTAARGTPYRRVAAAASLAVVLVAGGCSSHPGAVTAPPAATPPEPASALAGSQIMITLYPGSPQRWQRVLSDLMGRFSVQPQALWSIESLGVPCAVLGVPQGRDPAELAARIAADPMVESAQPVYRFQVLAGTPDPPPPSTRRGDPYAQLQHAARELGLPVAHRWATGRGVKVAVVDTGVDFSHPDLVDRIAGARDFVSRTADESGGRVGQGFSSDVHGTAVAGVIAASEDNGVGIMGVAPEAEVLALKACWPAKSGAVEATCDSYTLAESLDFAITQGAQVINLSLTGPKDPLLGRLIEAALKRDIPVVAASARPGEPGFPASAAGVLAVGSAPVDSLPGAPHPPLAAPGVDILTTVPKDAYDFLSGSSLAAAQVTGVVALLLQRHPGLAPDRIRQLLTDTSRPSRSDGPAIVDACAALAELTHEDRSACGEKAKPQKPAG